METQTTAPSLLVMTLHNTLAEKFHSAPTGTLHSTPADKLRVVIVGGGVAALEAALALAHLAPEHTDVTLIAPDREFVYRPMTVREPFAHGAAARYSLQRIAGDAGARLLADELDWIDPERQTIQTKTGETIEYDALVLALGAHAHTRYKHAVTIDDRQMDETLHGLVQDVEGGYIDSLAFVASDRMAWPLPLYELALMIAGRASDMGVELSTAIITPEESPLAVFGSTVSAAVGELLGRARILTINTPHVEIPSSGEVVIASGERHLRVDRVIALPELYGPAVRGIPLGEHGFIRVGPRGEVPGVEHVYAAGDATDFPVKFGGIAAQQADVAAQSIAALAGVRVSPELFRPVIHGMLLTGEKPVYLSAEIVGDRGFNSKVSDTPTWSPPKKIVARYLAPYLDGLDIEHGKQGYRGLQPTAMSFGS
jgi:sulfide:quinone oxidoreductase